MSDATLDDHAAEYERLLSKWVAPIKADLIRSARAKFERCATVITLTPVGIGMRMQVKFVRGADMVREVKGVDPNLMIRAMLNEASYDPVTQLFVFMCTLPEKPNSGSHMMFL